MKQNEISKVEFFFSQNENKEQIFSKDSDGNTLLHFAKTKRYLLFLFLKETRMVELLLSFGANIDAKNADGMTPLLYTMKLYPELTNVFIRNGADINATDNEGAHSLIHAAIKGEYS